MLSLKRTVITILSSGALVMNSGNLMAAEKIRDQQEIQKDIDAKVETLSSLQGKTDELSRNQREAISKQIKNLEEELKKTTPNKEGASNIKAEGIEPEFSLKRGKAQQAAPVKVTAAENKGDSEINNPENIHLEFSLKRGKAQQSLPIKATPLDAKQDKLDEEYLKFLYSRAPFKSKAHLVSKEFVAPQIYLKEYVEATSDIVDPLPGFDMKSFPPGKYDASGRLFWMQAPITKMSCEDTDQGWKIHITAVPKSAQKIAEIVLPILDNSPKLKIRGKESGCTVPYKIIESLPKMRTLSFIMSNFIAKDKKKLSPETQAGKFIAIYPSNLDMARAIITEIDQALQKAKEDGILDDTDFLPLVGDARVGNSGGVYVRYGKFTDQTVTPLVGYTDPCLDHGIGNVALPSALSQVPMACPPRAEKVPEGQADNRYFPWPNYMNSGDWRKTPNPFGKLPLVFKGKTWDMRPNSW